MTVEPASIRANWINSDCLAWSYIGISVAVGLSTSARRARRCSTARFAYSQALRGSLCGSTVPERVRRVRFRRGGPRQGLGVDILADAGQLAVSNRDGEDPVIVERLVRGLDLPPGEAGHQHPVALGDKLLGFCRRLQ